MLLHVEDLLSAVGQPKNNRRKEPNHKLSKESTSHRSSSVYMYTYVYISTSEDEDEDDDGDEGAEVVCRCFYLFRNENEW